MSFKAMVPATTPKRKFDDDDDDIFAGAQMKEDRHDIIPLGSHVCEVVDCEERRERGRWYVVTLRLVDTDARYVALFNLTPPWAMGLSELKAFAVAAAGLAPTQAQRETLPTKDLKRLIAKSEDDYDTIEDTLGKRGMILRASSGKVYEGVEVPSLIGQRVHAEVTAGKARVDENGEPTGDCFRKFCWSSAED